MLVTLLLYLLALLSNLDSNSQLLTTELLLVGLPGLFSVGIGALLVGQEKEQRTIFWLQSLPITKRELVRGKLIASLIGLRSVWIVSLVLVTVFSGGEYWRAGGQFADGDRLLNLAIHAAHTLFLLLAGLAISWRTNSAFIALVLLVPIAFVPFVVATLLNTAFSISPTESIGSVTLLLCQLVCCGMAALWGWRTALTALQPAVTSRGNSLASDRSIHLGSPYAKFSALLWQFARQNRPILFGLLSLFVLAVLLTLGLSPNASVQRGSLYSPSGILLTVNFGFLATSWLGVLVFQSDRVNRRIRFLADRGLSPAVVWLSRHAIPVCIVGLALPLIIAATARSIYLMTLEPSRGELLSIEILSLLVLPTLLAAFTAYSVSQWAGQLLSSPIVAAVTAPMISMAAVLYLVFNFYSVGTPLPLLLVAAVLPLIVTRIVMRRWMEDRWDRFYWIIHSAAVALFIVLPAIPLAYAWMTAPKMSSTTQTALLEHLKANSSYNFATTELTLQLPLPKEHSQSAIEYSAGGMVDSEVMDGLEGAAGSVVGADTASTKTQTLEDLTIQQRSDYIRQQLQAQLDRSSMPVTVDIAVIQWLRTEMMIHRLKASSSPARQAPSVSPADQPTTGGSSTTDSAASDLASSDPANTRTVSPSDRYNHLIDLATQISQRLRHCSLLSNQEMANRLEIAIVSELLQARGSGLLHPMIWENACEQVGDKANRDSARRTAIAATWRRYETAKIKDNATVGLDRSQNPVNLISIVTQKSRVSHVVELLWQLSDAKQGNLDSIRSQLAGALSVSPASYGLGNQGSQDIRAKLLVADDASAYLFEGAETLRYFSFGSQWHAGWERQAEQLANEGKTDR